MMFRTHLLFGLLFCLVSFYYFDITNILFFIILIFAAIIPDIDSSRSFLGKKVKFIEFVAYHRGIFHSIWLLLFFSFIFLIVNKMLAVAFFSGYLSHLILDSLTVSGITPFYPSGFRIKGFIRSNKLFDYLLFFLLVIVIVVLVIGHL